MKTVRTEILPAAPNTFIHVASKRVQEEKANYTGRATIAVRTPDRPNTLLMVNKASVFGHVEVSEMYDSPLSGGVVVAIKTDSPIKIEYTGDTPETIDAITGKSSLVKETAPTHPC